jgi:hypothetical protein
VVATVDCGCAQMDANGRGSRVEGASFGTRAPASAMVLTVRVSRVAAAAPTQDPRGSSVCSNWAHPLQSGARGLRDTGDSSLDASEISVCPEFRVE